jgi:exosortase H (IPTLxxWG-CTERM-specific)
MSKRRKTSDPRLQGRGSLRRQQKAQGTYASRLRGRAQKLVPYLRQNWTVVRACLIFAACMVAFFIIYSRLTDSSSFEGFRSFTARATAFVLNLFGGEATVDGTMVSSSDFSMGIIAACTGLIPFAIFAAAVAAYPATIRQKTAGVALGIAAIFAVNIVRTTTLFALGAHFPGFFDAAHYLVWQSLMILAAAALWLLWVSRLTHEAKK